MVTEYVWHDKAMEALGNTVELLSPGGLSFAVGEDGHALAVAPSLLEYEEEEHNLFSFFNFDISGFAEIFDRPPTIDWRTYPESELLFEGSIDGEEALVHVYGHPFEDAQPVGIIDTDGNLHEIPQEAKASMANGVEDTFAKQHCPFVNPKNTKH